MLPRGLTKLTIDSIESPQHCTLLGLPEGLVTLDIDTTGLEIADYRCLPRGITDLTLRGQHHFLLAHSAALPQGLVCLSVSAAIVTESALSALPPTLIAIKLLKQELFPEFLDVIPRHVKYIEAELASVSGFTPEFLVETVIERELHWLGPSRGIPSLFKLVGVDSAIDRLLEHRNTANATN